VETPDEERRVSQRSARGSSSGGDRPDRHAGADDLERPIREDLLGAGSTGPIDDEDELHAELKFLREEVELLRRRLESSPSRIRMLEERVIEMKGQLQDSLEQNQKLSETLRAAREQLVALREEVERLSAPPQSYAAFLDFHEDEGTVDISSQGRKLRVNVAPEVAVEDLRPGQEVRLNEAMNVVATSAFEDAGEVMVVSELLGDGRVVAVGRGDDERIVKLADPLLDGPLKAGDSVLVDSRANYALEVVPKAEVEQLILEEVPDITYEHIGGLADQVEAIRDAVELPYLHADLFHDHDLTPPKGILLYGPPGCGKTLIAKAVANSLAQRVAEKTGRAEARSYFLNVKGPELLNKYVGETERQIRLIFQRAREKSAEGYPVIVFFDEMDSLFRTRGSGVSSDVENTIVPQLLAEIDGVESLKDVVVIGASNREDMIDPAILRPGRLDVKIKIERPDGVAAREIFSIYLHPDLPLHEDEVSRHDGDRRATIEEMIDRTVTKMYAEDEDNRFLEVTYANGEKEVLHFKDFNSGAMIENVVARAKKVAIKRLLATGERGLKTEDLITSIREEWRENEDLPNTTNPDDWARISGKKGERIVYVRTLLSGDGESAKAIENVNAGQYL
jgi:proteasome-associated ATPase